MSSKTEKKIYIYNITCDNLIQSNKFTQFPQNRILKYYVSLEYFPSILAPRWSVTLSFP